MFTITLSGRADLIRKDEMDVLEMVMIGDAIKLVQALNTQPGVQVDIASLSMTGKDAVDLMLQV